MSVEKRAMDFLSHGSRLSDFEEIIRLPVFLSLINLKKKKMKLDWGDILMLAITSSNSVHFLGLLKIYVLFYLLFMM